MNQSYRTDLLTRIADLVQVWLDSAQPVTTSSVEDTIQSCSQYWQQRLEDTERELRLDLFVGSLLMSGYEVGAPNIQCSLEWVPVRLNMVAVLDGIALVTRDSTDDIDALRDLIEVPTNLFVLVFGSSCSTDSWVIQHPKTRVVSMESTALTFTEISIVGLIYRSEWDLTSSRADKNLLGEMLRRYGINWKHAVALHDRWMELAQAA